MVRQSKILTNLQIMRIISISDIIDILNITRIIGITLSAWVSVLHIPENVVDQMNDILVQHENLLRDKSFGRVSEQRQCS